MRYGEELRFGDELWGGYVKKQKLANCAFTKVFPGDILGINFYIEYRGDGFRVDCGMLFVRVVSVSLPIAEGLFKRDRRDQIVVDLPNGERKNLFKILDMIPSDHPNYDLSQEVIDYARRHYYISDRWVKTDEYRCFSVYSYRGREAYLKENMLEVKERQAREKANRERKAREAADAARAKAQDAARHAAARRELDDLFSKM